MTNSGEPGHTAWVDSSGKFAVPLNLTRAAPTVSIAVILTAGALDPDKGLSLRTVRHEMVHARHKLKVLEAVKAWQKTSGKQSFDEWLTGQAKRGKMTDLDVALIGKGAKDASANTEVLGYVEGFMHDFHRRPAMGPGPALARRILGAVRTTRLDTWRQADKSVQDEAMARLQAYYATLDAGPPAAMETVLGRPQVQGVGEGHRQGTRVPRPVGRVRRLSSARSNLKTCLQLMASSGVERGPGDGLRLEALFVMGAAVSRPGTTTLPMPRPPACPTDPGSASPRGWCRAAARPVQRE